MKPTTAAAIVLTAVFAKGCMTALHEDAKNDLTRECAMAETRDKQAAISNTLINMGEPGCGV
jgi:hypothetical protein